jgi:hypothetical protein
MPVPRIITPNDLSGEDPSELSNPDRYETKYLAEGDSWFSLGAAVSSNILQGLRLPQRALILSLARPGQTLVHMSIISRNNFLKHYLTEEKDTWKWNAILLSGGGNDLIDKISTIVRRGSGNDPAAYIEGTELDGVLARIAEGYTRIVETRDAPNALNRGVPIVVHTYDRVTPRDAPARLGVIPVGGPWLIGTYESCGILDSDLQCAITDRIFDRLTQTLVSLETRLPNFRVVDTTGTLRRAAPGSTGNSRDWLNEIHANSGGYKKIAAKIAPLL